MPDALVTRVILSAMFSKSLVVLALVQLITAVCDFKEIFSSNDIVAKSIRAGLKIHAKKSIAIVKFTYNFKC